MSPAVAGVQLGELASAEPQPLPPPASSKQAKKSRPGGGRRVGKRKWTELEDLTLLSDIVVAGKNWAAIADKYEKAGILCGRNNVRWGGVAVLGVACLGGGGGGGQGGGKGGLDARPWGSRRGFGLHASQAATAHVKE